MIDNVISTIKICRMDDMMRGQRGWRELAILGDKINRFTGMIEGLIWSPRSSDANDRVDNWAFEEVGLKAHIYSKLLTFMYYGVLLYPVNSASYIPLLLALKKSPQFFST